MSASLPCWCGCTRATAHATHVVATALSIDDVDVALQAGLLTVDVCPDCAPICQERLMGERDARRNALDARERFRQRETRLARKRDARDRRRSMAQVPRETGTPVQALPPAAAAALARAKQRAAGHRPS